MVVIGVRSAFWSSNVVIVPVQKAFSVSKMVIVCVQKSDSVLESGLRFETKIDLGKQNIDFRSNTKANIGNSNMNNCIYVSVFYRQFILKLTKLT